MTGVGMGRRPLLLMVLGWLAVVVAVGAITFLVVDRAGRGVGQASAAERVAVLPSSTSPPASREPSPASPEPTPTTRVTPEVTSSSAPEPTPTRTPSDDGRDTESFSSDGGTVVATCTGSQISLDSIRPRDGWRFEKESEHGGLEVRFETDERRVDILLICVRGVPTSSTDDD